MRTKLAKKWKSLARHLSHIEMEAGGVQIPAHRKNIPLLSVRGISDIVGFERESEWTEYACRISSSFLYALLSRLPLNCFGNLEPIVPSGEPDSHGEPVQSAFSDDPPTFKEIETKFNNTSKSLLNRKVSATNLMPWPQLDEVQKFLNDDEDFNVLCILGSPGSGKTALMAHIASESRSNEITTLAIKADMVDPEVSASNWGVSELEIGIAFGDAVELVSSQRRVVVIVDQLDAVASTVDRSSSRLNLLIDFIQRCSRLHNVKVVFSSRVLEFERDTRFRRIDAQEITLQLPEWKDVALQLVNNGIENYTNWSDDFKQLLRTPQHLRVFLERYESTGRSDPVASYHVMLDEIWGSRVDTNHQRELLDVLVKELMKSETIWSPLVRFESYRKSIDELVQRQLLQIEDQKIGFKHQTLLEHAKARHFTKSNESLCDFILKRQNALFVRPTVWAVLSYLRTAHPEKYRCELESLFESELRLHIEYLLIEFLGKVADPQDFEIVWLADQLSKEDFRTRAMIAVRGSRVWFDALRRSHIPAVMGLELAQQWPLIGVFQESLKFDRETSLQLIETHWLDNSRFDALTWRVARAFESWDDRTIALATRLIKRLDADLGRSIAAESLVYEISKTHPEKACEVFMEVMLRHYPIRNNGKASVKIGKSPLESRQGWYKVGDVAEAAPFEFLKAIWNWLVNVIEYYHDGYRGSVLNTYHGNCFTLDDSGGLPHYPLVLAILSTIDSVASTNPKEFLSITAPTWNTENGVVHRLIIRGLRCVASTHPDEVLNYLFQDGRRLFLGSLDSHGQSDSIELIASLVPHLNSNQYLQLEAYISNWSCYLPDAEREEGRDVYEREARLRLLDALPAASRSKMIAELISKEKRELPNWDKAVNRSRSGRVQRLSPMSKEELVVALDDEVLQSLESAKTPTNTLNNFNEDDEVWTEMGGGYELGETVGQLAKDDLTRALNLIVMLTRKGHHEAANAAINSLDSANCNDEHAFDLIRRISEIDSIDEEMRASLGRLANQHCRTDVGLPDDVCEILESFLASEWDTSYAVFNPDARDDDAIPEVGFSHLWAPQGGLLNSDRSFWPLLAVGNGYLMRTPPDTEKWLNAIDEHLNRGISARTWIAYCTELRWIGLKGCDREQGEKVISKLFSKNPSVLQDSQGVRLTAHVSSYLSVEFVQNSIQTLRDTGTFEGRQAYAELLALIAIRDNQQWAIDQLAEVLDKLDDSSSWDEAIATGIAMTATNMWGVAESRGDAVKLLCRLIPLATQRIANALSSMFWSKDELKADQTTEALLEALANSPKIFAIMDISEFIEHLLPLAVHSRDIVLKVCEVILESGRLDTDTFRAEPHLVSIALTLQRFPDSRERGLALFEQFLKRGVDDAFKSLTDIDRRPFD